MRDTSAAIRSSGNVGGLGCSEVVVLSQLVVCLALLRCLACVSSEESIKPVDPYQFQRLPGVSNMFQECSSNDSTKFTKHVPYMFQTFAQVIYAICRRGPMKTMW